MAAIFLRTQLPNSVVFDHILYFPLIHSQSCTFIYIFMFTGIDFINSRLQNSIDWFCSHNNNKIQLKAIFTVLLINKILPIFLLFSLFHLFHLPIFVWLNHIEIPRVIAAQQQNTAPEVQQYDSDPYQTDSDNAPNNGRKITHLIILDIYKIN